MRGKSNETWIIFAEEVRRHLRSGGYLFFTVAICLLMVAAIWVVPLIQEAIASDAPPSGVTGEVDLGRIGFVDNSGVFSGLEGQAPVRYGTRAEGLEAYQRGEIGSLYVVADDYLASGKVEQYAEFKLIWDENWDDAGAFWGLLSQELLAQQNSLLSPELLAQRAQVEELVAEQLSQVSPELVARVAEPAVFKNFKVADDGSVSEVGTTARAIWEMILPVFFAMLLMFSIIAGVGNMVTSVSEEKENRLVELVITSASPFSIMAGKLLALGVIGLTQAVVWVVVAAFTVPAMFDQIPDLSGLAIPANLAVTILACFITGYFLTAAIAILVGATANSARDASRMAPMISMVGFVPVWLMGLLMNQPDGLITRLLSYIPFTAPTGILLRISAGGEMTGSAIAAALGGVVATGILFLWVAGRVFRGAMLMQGQSFTPRNLWTALRNAD
ncbi:MAG: ABC transporter permease [Dehalococcoidales bacterium]|nr:ABC transporter permease [Dehalococcoidales bacterium]